MRESDAVFSGSVPEIYDRYLGPLLMEPYAVDLAARVATMGAQNLLELAAGTGIVTRALARTLPKTFTIVASDLNQPMIDFAAAHSNTGIIWRQADAMKLPFEDLSFDLVICQFGIMFVPDKQAAYREALRVLRAAGSFVFSVWDRIQENELSQQVTEVLATLFPNDPPQFLERTPFGYHDTGQIRRELHSTGFRSIVSKTVALRSRADSPMDAAIGLCQGSPLRNEIEARDATGLARVTEAVTASLAGRFGTGPIDAKMQAHVITASR